MTPTSYASRATQYALDVTSGKILACSWVTLACQRHLDDLAKVDSRWRYDVSRADKVCAFAERMRHEKGRLQGQAFRLEPWQIFILSSIFGWVDIDGTRKYREAFVLVPRGNGKSPLAAIIGLWMGFFDGEPGAEVVCGATTEAQAHEVFRPAKAMVEQVLPAFARVGVIAAAKSIYQAATRSRFRPVIGKAKYGGSPYCAILDEGHQLPDAQLYDTFKTGCNKRRNSLLLLISTAGVTAANNPCYMLQGDVQKMLQSVVPNERLFGIIYTADPDIEWTSRDAVRMANPNLGISNDAEALYLDHQEAIRNPAKQNIFRTMHLDQWMTAAAGWLNMSHWRNCLDETLNEESLRDLPCWIGSDLASKLDLAATIRLYRDDTEDKPEYYCFARCYLPEAQVNAPGNQHYQKWQQEGHLIVTSGSSIDYSMIETDTLADIAAAQIQELCYDPRYADQWSQRVSDASGVIRVEVPPSPDKLSPAMKEVEAAVADGRFHHDGHPVLTWCMSNVLTRETSAGNYTMPAKEKPENKIDAAVALFIAMYRAMLTPAANTNDLGFMIV